MKELSHTLIANLLNHLPSEMNYREFFGEHISTTQVKMINGNISSAITTENGGFSLSGRSKSLNKSIFLSSSTLENIDQEAQDFLQTHPLPNHQQSFYGSTQFSDIGSLSIIQKFPEYFSELKTLLSDPIITSSLLLFSVSHRQYCVATSESFPQYDHQLYLTFIVSLTGSKDSQTEEVYGKVSFTHDLDSFSLPAFRECIIGAKNDLYFLFEAAKSPSGSYPAVFGTEAGGVIIHEAIGHGLEADLLQGSVYRDQIGHQIAHPSVDILEDPTIPSLRGSYTYDHEGVPASKKYLVRNGILESYMHSRKTADIFGVLPNGHARRETYAHPTLVRMGVTFLTTNPENKTTRDDLIASISDGIYISKMGGGQVDTSTGDFVFKVQRGYRIRDGKIAEGIRGAMVSGNGPEVLRNIQGVANDLSFFDGGTCGKGQHMPVSDGTASFSAQVTITGQ